jgi:hypothetical protein
MTTTFELWGESARRSYSTLPTIDVPVLEHVRHCEDCGSEIVFGIKGRPPGLFGEWSHKDGDDSHRVFPRLHCTYCHNDEPGTVHFHQRAWSDETECDRCGGIDGFPIGD